MKNINFLKPSKINVVINNKPLVVFSCNKENVYVEDDVTLKLVQGKHGVEVYLHALTSSVSRINLEYSLNVEDDDLVFIDSIERGYGDMSWSTLNNQRSGYWYAFIDNPNNKLLNAYGVNVQCNSIVSFILQKDKLFVDINTLSGGVGVYLQNRTLHACTLISNEYKYENVFDSCKEFLRKLMCDIKMKEVGHNVYGFNNWYYAYGESSYEQIIKDTKLLKEVTTGLKTTPYMVIDDGWSVNPCGGPWVVNEKFGDMEKLAKEMKDLGVIPGIWFRPLKDTSGKLKQFTHPNMDFLLDPTCPEVIEQIESDVTNFVNWGYQLIKLDFVTVDITWKYGFQMEEGITDLGWRYKDNHYTNAEIILNMYRAIESAANGKAILIGCNAIGHLCAGICELNRIGDDTSGQEWERTRKMGVNSLAFRLIQNDVFYKIDADCVGIMGLISWEKNKQWLDVLAKSGSPLFVSCDPKDATEEIKEDLRKAFIINEQQSNVCYPVDYSNNLLPNKWSIDGEIVEYDWE